MDLAHHPMRLELSIVTMMMGNDYFPSLVYRRDWLVQKFVRRYKGNLPGGLSHHSNCSSRWSKAFPPQAVQPASHLFQPRTLLLLHKPC